ncbi:MAG: SDR family oxidoreductase, partial [Burkholderiales bacterium]|nr:SDR family oxidoreductase [Burkholderiales bacterium]
KERGAGDCIYFHADVADSAEVRRAIGATAERWRHIDIVVNNAAILKTGRLIETDEADWDKTIAVNLRGPFLVCKYAIPKMKAKGAIVNVSSIHAVATDAKSAAYGASKGGLESLTRALALECFEQQIRVNAVRLGAVDTSMLWDNPSVKSGEEKVNPLEIGEPSEIAEAILFLASDRASFVSGAVLNVDGGRLPVLASHAG